MFVELLCSLFYNDWLSIVFVRTRFQNGLNKQVDKPDKTVLIHRFNVRKVLVIGSLSKHSQENFIKQFWEYDFVDHGLTWKTDYATLFVSWKIVSCTQKNKTAACDAVGKYPDRVVSISFSVIAASFCFWLISSERTFELERIRMAVSSSRMLPSDARTSRILSSISFNLFLFY